MVHKSGASTSSEHVEKIDDISKKSSAHGGHKSDEESTTTAAMAANTKNPPKIDNGINFESKRKLRTSRRLNSLNPDLLPQPPLPSYEKSIDSAASNHQSQHHTKWSGLTADAVLAQPLCAPKPIRNRRYTINECSNAKDVTVPFQAKNKHDTIVLSNCLTNTTTTAAIDTTTTASNKTDRKRSCDDLNLLGDRLNCSVSLERLTGIIDTLVYQTNATNRADSEEASGAGSNGGGGINKILCLYCDRSFSSQKLYGKHLERLHQSTSGRRSSARTSNSEVAATYPGCFYCNSGKLASLSGAELIQLVHHLVDEHRDKYFACKSCMIRYPSRDQLQQHLSKEHKIDNNSRKRNTKKVQSPVDDTEAASVDAVMAPDDDIAGDEAAVNEPILRSLRLRRSKDANKKATATTTNASSKPQLLTTEETFLSRLGITQNRSPRSRKGAKNRRGCSSELFPLETSRASRASKNSKSTQQNLVSETIEFNAPKVSNNKCEPVASLFDEDFYESVNLNVKLNLSCHLDGKLKSEGEESDGAPCPVNALANVPAVRSILVKSPVFAETEIHEATTTISAFTAFPTLLTAQQYGAEFQAGKMKKPITKNSWKWKWDCVKKYKWVNEGGKIVKKVKQPLAGLRDLSKLDMWTQLTMRTKHETVARQVNELGGSDDSMLAVGEVAREEKRKLIAQLNQILDKRVLPQINVEQSDQTIIKIEFAEELIGLERTLLAHISAAGCSGSSSTSTSSGADEHDFVQDSNFPASLHLFKRDCGANASKAPVVLSGEWARPRCYICVGCGSRFSTVRSLEEHKASKHPFVHSTHYEIVGKELIDGDLFRNFFIPSMALQRHNEYNQTTTQFGSNVLCGVGGGDDSMDSVTSYSLSITKSDSIDHDSSSRNSKVSVSSTGTATSSSLSIAKSDSYTSSDQLAQNPTACSKCQRECNGTMDLYRHMLDCSSDYAWLLAKKRNHIKYRYFGSRRRRTQRTSMSNTRKTVKSKKERDTTSDGASSASKSKEPTTPRPRPSDAESIQRMLENLPAKRAARQIFPNLTPKPVKSKKFVPNAMTRGGKILVKQKTAGGNTRSYKILSTSTTINTVGANLVLRKRRNVDQQLRLKRSTDVGVSGGSIVTIRRTRATATTNPKSATRTSHSKEKMVGVVKTPPTRKGDGKNGLGNVIRRRTKAVVKKITSTFRKGNKKHIIRTPIASTSGGCVKGAAAATSNEAQKKRKLLRSISFRRSTRNIRKSDASKVAAAVADVEEKPVSMNEVVAISTQSDEQPIPSENLTEDIIGTGTSKNVQDEAIQTVTEIASEPPPKLKRKRSIKTIINDIRAKCQNKNNAVVTENGPIPLSTVVEIEAKPAICVEPVVIPMPQVSVTSPLSLTIETNENEPLNLCVTSRDRSDADKMVTPTTSSLSVPATTPLSSGQQSSESISPRRRTRKINDCIAMLTGKLQEKLGVPFIDHSSSLLAVLGTDALPKDEQQPTSTSTEKLATSSEKQAADVPAADVPAADVPTADVPAADVPAATPKIVESDLSATIGSAAENRSEETIGDSVHAEPQPSADSSSQPKEDVKTGGSLLESFSVVDKMELEKIEDIEIDQNIVVEAVVDLADAVKIQDSNDAMPSDDKPVLEVAIEIAAQEAKGEIDVAIVAPVETVTCETTAVIEPVVEPLLKLPIDITLTESAKEEMPSEKITTAKRTPNRKQKSATPKTKAAKSKEKPNKKAGKKLEIVAKISEMEKPEVIQQNEESPLAVVVYEICGKDLVADNEPTATLFETKISCVEPEAGIRIEEKQSTEEPIIETANVELPLVEAPVDISISSDKIDASVKTVTPKSRKTANLKRRASTATKSVEIADKQPSKHAEKVVRLPVSTQSFDRIETPAPSKATAKGTKKSQSNVKRETVVETKARIEKSTPKTVLINDNTSGNGTPSKSKRSTPTSKKPQVLAVDSIFESSDEELLPWDPESKTGGFMTSQSDAKESDSTPSQTPSSIAATPTPTPSITATQTPTPLITDKPVADPKPKKKRKNELAQIIADQLLESFKEVDKSRIGELKKIHDLSLSSSDDLLTTSLSTTPTPKRKSKKIFENFETKSRTQSPKVDAKKTPEAKNAKETTVELTTAIETPSPQKNKEVDPLKVNKSRSKRNDIQQKVQPIAVDNTKTSSAPIETEAMAKDGGASEFSAAVPTKIVENVPKKSSGNIFLDGFSETLFADVDKNHLNASIERGVPASKTVPDPNEITTIAPTTTTIATPTLTSSTTTTLSTTTPTTNAALKAPAVFGESLFSQQNLKTTRLSDLIGGANNKIVETVAKVSPMKNKSVENLISFDKLGEIKSNARAPFMSPRWDSNAPDDNKVELKNKVNFWSRNIGDDKSGVSNQKSRLFAVIKNKAEKMFTKMSKKKLKRSLKASISSSSSSSTSSSTSSCAVPKRPLLRPSILSCNSKTSASCPQIGPKITPQPPGVVDDSTLLIAPDVIQPVEIVTIAPRKIGSIRRRTMMRSTEDAKVVDPKSPIESDMNIAKIVIALEKSNRKSTADESQLNNAFIADDQRTSMAPFKEHKQQKPTAALTEPADSQSTAVQNSADGHLEPKWLSAGYRLGSEWVSTQMPQTPPPLRIPVPTAAPPSITTDLLNDSSQDTMISEIVSKIREKVNRTDSDDDLCLAEVAKGLNNRSPSVEFDLTPQPKVNDFSNLNTNLNASRPPSQPADDSSSVKVIADPSEENDVADTPEDENTNTEVLDMDLEDDASEYTAMSHDTSTTSIGGSKKRKRKKRSILSRRNNRRAKKRDDSFVLPAETYFCDVCRKSFKNQSGLTSHKATITHIAKLSEQEFLEAKKSVEATLIEDDGDTKLMTKEPAIDAAIASLAEQNESNAAIEPSTMDKLKIPASNQLLDMTSSSQQQQQLQPQPQNENSPNSDRVANKYAASSERVAHEYSTNTALSLSMNARMSQEQRLFYECCSMLKGSDRSTTTTATTATTTSPTVAAHENSKNELASNPITPKTNQHHTNIAHSAQSPRSHPSPRPGIPTLDLNQFSDISSDSNPAYSCPQIPSSSKTLFSLDPSETVKADADKEADVATHVSTVANYQYARAQPQQRNVDDKVKGDAVQRNSSIIVRNYPDTFSDMGDSFPSSQDASESENYAQTILERSVHIHDSAALNHSMRTGHSSKVNDSGYNLTAVPAALNPDSTEFQTCSNRSNFDSPMHSTSSQSSSISRPRTKAAMKGYEDLKVSIPTTGLDMQQALERSPNAGANSCKLATLADIALGNDVPVCLERTSYMCAEKTTKASMKTDGAEHAATKKSIAAEAKKAEALRLSGDLVPKGKKRSQKNTGHLLGFRERKKRSRPAAKDKAKNGKFSMQSAELEAKQKDVYDFEETQDSIDTAIAPLTHTRPSKIESASETKAAANSTHAKGDGGQKKTCDEPEDESSYSDRDDYYNFNSMSGSGTEDDGVATESESLKSLKSAKSLKAGQLQKKCLIMGRIFKKAKKSPKPIMEKVDKEIAKPIPKKQLDEIFDNLRTSPIKTKSNATKEKDVEKRSEKVVDVPAAGPAVCNDSGIDMTPKEHRNENATQHSNQAAAAGGTGKPRKSREVANLEAEWGMSMEQIKELIGVGKRKTQRRCASNRQNKFMETWSSDEYEEFHSTKDIIALIEEAEMKAKRAKARANKCANNANTSTSVSSSTATATTNTTATVTTTAKVSVVVANAAEAKRQQEAIAEQNATTKTTDTKMDKENSKKGKNKMDEGEPKLDASSNKLKTKKTTTFSGVRSDDSDFDEHWNKTAKRAKIRNRRRTIASREDMINEEKPKTKPRSKAKQMPPQNADNAVCGNKTSAIASAKVVPGITSSEKKKETDVMETIPKQNAPVTMAPATNKKPPKPMPRRKRIASEMLYYWSSSSDEEFGRIKQSENEDGETSDIHIEQHGWIVGDSHKKLVTLLAHAKGKKIDDCAVKEAAHKKK